MSPAPKLAELLTVAEDLAEATEKLIELNDEPADGKFARALGRFAELKERGTRGPSEKHGWAKYPIPPSKNGGFVEDLSIISELVGSIDYETQRYDGVWYVRRIV